MARPRSKKQHQYLNMGKSIFNLSPEEIGYYHGNCYDFVCDLILAPVWDKVQPSHQQKETMDEISKYDRVLIDAGHGTGRSTTFTWVGLWFLETRPSPCRVPCTAPTGHQIKDILWSNFSRWISSSLVVDDLEWMATEIRHKNMEQPHFALARTSNKSANMQGQHEEHMLWLIDECYGILDPLVWETIEGSLTQDDNKILMGGQPTLISGYCADARNPKKSPNWRRLRHSSEDAPVGIMKPSWVEDMYRKWGKNSDVCRVRVRGLPPLGNPKAFISLAQVMQAVGREIDKDGPFEIGVDPAHEGDDMTAMATRKGYFYFPLECQQRTDEFQIVAMILNRVRQIRNEFSYTSRIRVKIENIGGYGHTAIKILQNNKTDNIEVVAITGGGGGNSEYANASTVMWGEFRDHIHKMHLPENDDDLIGQLSTREYGIDQKSNKIILESKKLYKKRSGGVSPDRADAMVLCWTRQAVRVRVLEFETAACMTTLKIKWEGLGFTIKPIVSVWLGDDGKLTAIVGIWKQEVRKLFCVLAQTFPVYLPENVLPTLTATVAAISAGKVVNLLKFDWVGNKPFDAVGMGSVKDAWGRYGVHVRVNDRYEMDGAIMAMSRMFTRQAIIFDENRADSVPAAMQEWYVDEKDDAPGVVMAALNMVSLFNDEYVPGPDSALIPYTERKQEAQEAAMKKLEKGVRVNLEESQGAEGGWMA